MTSKTKKKHNKNDNNYNLINFSLHKINIVKKNQLFRI